METKIQRLFKSNNDLFDLGKKILKNGIRANSKINFFVEYIFLKADRTHRAISLLCKEELGEDAFILCRALFETEITCKYILKDETNYRLDRFFDYNWINELEKIKMNQDHYLNLITKNKNYALKYFEECKKTISIACKVRNKYKYKYWGWSDKRIKGMAEEVGEKSYYETLYKTQSYFIHSSSNTMHLCIDSKSQSLFWIDNALVCAFYLYSSILVIANRYLNDNPKKFDKDFSSMIKYHAQTLKMDYEIKYGEGSFNKDFKETVV